MNLLESKELVFVLAILVLATMIFNIGLQGQIGAKLDKQNLAIEYIGPATSTVSVSGTQASSEQNTSTSNTLSFEEFLPKGVPRGYGAELGVSFDDPVGSLEILSALDGDLYPTGSMHFADLTEQQQQDYILVGTSISCEFCCGAVAITAPNGQPACGCAHSAAMRGVAMYLVKNHRDDFTNEEILDELNQWKKMFFPKQMYQRAVEANGSSAVSVLDEVPDMVGGC